MGRKPRTKKELVEVQKSQLYSSDNVDENLKDISNDLQKENNIDKVKDLTNLFNLNIQKKNASRILKMNELLETATNKISERFEKTPENFSNEDLLKFMQAFENSIDKSNKSLSMISETPPIQLQQNNQVNITVGETLSRESRDKILDVVKNILNQTKNNNIIETERIVEENDT